MWRDTTTKADFKNLPSCTNNSFEAQLMWNSEPIIWSEHNETISTLKQSNMTGPNLKIPVELKSVASHPDRLSFSVEGNND
jgi:hypothetical protein